MELTRLARDTYMETTHLCNYVNCKAVIRFRFSFFRKADRFLNEAQLHHFFAKALEEQVVELWYTQLFMISWVHQLFFIFPPHWQIDLFESTV